MSQEPDLWVAVVAALRRNRIPSAVLPTEIEIRLSFGGPVHLPLFPPEITAQVNATAAPLILSPSQERLVESLVEGPKTAAKLRQIEPNLYRPGAGMRELEEWTLIEKFDGKWQLTGMGLDWAKEHGLAPEEDDA